MIAELIMLFGVFGCITFYIAPGIANKIYIIAAVVILRDAKFFFNYGRCYKLTCLLATVCVDDIMKTFHCVCMCTSIIISFFT